LLQVLERQGFGLAFFIGLDNLCINHTANDSLRPGRDIQKKGVSPRRTQKTQKKAKNIFLALTRYARQ